MEQKSQFPKYAEIIRTINLASIRDANSIPNSLTMVRDGALSVHYIPFDYINTDARIVLVGITPGFTQLKNALAEAQKQLKAGVDHKTALMGAKKTGAFSGAMRTNLVNMLNELEVNKWLGISSCEELFQKAAHLVHTTSALRFPVFVDGENYNGTPNMTRHPLLRQLMQEHFAREVALLPKALFVPMGPKVSEALTWLAREGVMDSERILDGMPHPSGANAERISYFLGKKPASELSVKTNASLLDAAKASLREKMMGIRAQVSA